MKKIKKATISTDYFFEAVFKKAKSFLFTRMPSKLAAIKLFTMVSWFKDIN